MRQPSYVARETVSVRLFAYEPIAMGNPRLQEKKSTFAFIDGRPFATDGAVIGSAIGGTLRTTACTHDDLGARVCLLLQADRS
jgi:hypothetical protein